MTAIQRLVAALLIAASSSAAGASEIELSPSPPRAGEPFTITYHGHSFGCESIGELELLAVSGQHIALRVLPPGCVILPTGIQDYVAELTLGPLAAGDYEIAVYEPIGNGLSVVQLVETVTVVAPPACEATTTSLCLGGARFEVTAEWTDFADRSGPALAVPDERNGLSTWGVLWFFSPENPELLVKVLDGCAHNGHYWVFLSPASTVAYEIRVRDTQTGEVKAYEKPLHEVPELTADTLAFRCS